MNCEFIYFIVPKTSLQDTVEKQARLAATSIVNNVDRTMKLEKQATSKSASQSIIEEIVRQLLQKNDRRIWKNK